MTPLIDGLQYANWSEKIFRQMRAGGVDAVHVTITYHESFRETVLNIEKWNRWFERFPDLIFQGFTAADIEAARQTGRTAIFFGSQNPSCIEDDIGLVEVLHRLGMRFMQLTYNNQSLLATGCYEAEDKGLSRMGREVVREMNRVGMVVDMSHSGERSTLEAIEHSTRPIAITHANPASWYPARRNKSDTVLKALAESGGMLGLSLYPHHLRGGSQCSLQDFCDMAARAIDVMGPANVGIGSADAPGFPPMPDWFEDNRDFGRIAEELRQRGLSEAEVTGIMGGNWMRFFTDSFGPEGAA
jgi:membrane dipeptidase